MLYETPDDIQFFCLESVSMHRTRAVGLPFLELLVYNDGNLAFLSLLNGF